MASFLTSSGKPFHKVGITTETAQAVVDFKDMRVQDDEGPFSQFFKLSPLSDRWTVKSL